MGWQKKNKRHHGSLEMKSKPENRFCFTVASVILQTKQSIIKTEMYICCIKALLALSHAPKPLSYHFELLSWPSVSHPTQFHTADQVPWATVIEQEDQSIALDVQTQGSPQPPPDAISQHTSILIILSHLQPRQGN